MDKSQAQVLAKDKNSDFYLSLTLTKDEDRSTVYIGVWPLYYWADKNLYKFIFVVRKFYLILAYVFR